MTAIDPLGEQRSVKLRQRLWGAAVFIALLVIFLPLLLDGSGSESQYRRVERLRAEPPRILNADGTPEKPVEQPVATVATPETPATPVAEAITESVTTTASVVAPEPEIAPAPAARVETGNGQGTQPLRAWVVQAGSFEDESNALAVRDKLRRAGYPSFVTPSDSELPLYRVRVGPMINLQQAERSRDKVMSLLGREAIVVSYP